MTNRQLFLFSVLAVCTLSGAVLLTMHWISPPEPLPAGAPATQFSALRALRDLEVIAQQPHPVGSSPAHAAVRDFLLDEIRALGLQPHVQKTFGYFVSPGSLSGGFVENILVRLPGIEPQGAILLMSHYDSSPGAPGAVDSGSGVVTILEILRALQAGAALRQDVIILFTDGEEPGTFGAQAFVSQHPWMADVRWAINMDQFWVGPPTLVRSSPGNGLFIRALARSSLANHPAHISFPFEIFPSGDTDISPFLLAGTGIAEFNGGGPFAEKHTALDLPALVDPGSLQQAGNQILALVRELGGLSTWDADIPDQTFFPLMGFLVHYSRGFAWPLALLAGFCYLGMLVSGIRKGFMTWRGMWLGLLAWLLSLGVSVVVTNMLWRGVLAFHPEYGYDSTALFRQKLSFDSLYVIGLMFSALAISVTVFVWATRKIKLFDQAAGALFLWLPLTLCTTLLIPATSYLFSWVLLCSSLALLLAMAIQSKKQAWVLSGLGFLASATMACFLWIPLFYFAILAGPLSPDSSLLSILIGLVVVWIGSIIPVLDRIASPHRWLFPVAAALVAAGFILSGHFLAGQGSPPALVHPVGYWLDANSGSAFWLGFSDDLDERQTHLLLNPTSRSYTDLLEAAPTLQILTSAAPTLGQDGPRLEVIADDWVAGNRMLEVKITTSLYERIILMIPMDAQLKEISLPNGEHIELPVVMDTGWWLRFEGVPVEGFSITLVFSGEGAFQLQLIEEMTGLPSFPGIQSQPEPGTMKSPGVFTQVIPTDFTVIKREYTIWPVNDQP